MAGIEYHMLNDFNMDVGLHGMGLAATLGEIHLEQ